MSLHVRSRMFNTLDDAASFIRGVSIMYEVYADIRRSKAPATVAADPAAAAAAAATTAASGGGTGGGAAAAAATATGGATNMKKDEAVQVPAGRAAWLAILAEGAFCTGGRAMCRSSSHVSSHAAEVVPQLSLNQNPACSPPKTSTAP